MVYPNPPTGGTVTVVPPGYANTAKVKVQVFTVSFRKVIEEDFGTMPHGALQLTLRDRWGRPLSPGLYYVAVCVGDKRTVAKLTITYR